MNYDPKKHWETVYESKTPEQISWAQEVPKTSLDLIHCFGLSKDAKIIDIGGGDGKLVDHLLKEDFRNITVLDISAKALGKAKKRLGDKAKNVKWIVSDITDFQPNTEYDVWHDRAMFHFLTDNQKIASYIDVVRKAVNDYLIMATFSDNGPQKCSGLDIRQYNEETLTAAFQNDFEKLQCITEDHVTPFGTKQNFLFCSFKRRTN
jgi:cyclopropane fatty-acyl-phospholipid synthase-like methyltransferase